MDRSIVVDCAAAGERGKSRARQSESVRCDLNEAVKRYKKTGAITGPLSCAKKAIFADFSDLGPDSFMIAQNAIKNASDAFLNLPSRVRERFANDPGKLLQFLSDDSNFDEAVKLGLATPPKKVDVDIKKTEETA